MNRSRQLQAPIITFLSPSLTASKKATSLLSALGKFENISVVTDDDTHVSTSIGLNDTLKSNIPWFSRYSWDSIGAKDAVSGSVIHFCSIGRRGINVESKEENKNAQDRNQQNIPFSLLAITDTSDDQSDDSKKKESDGNANAEVDRIIRNVRCLLASKINEGGFLNRTSLILKYFFKGKLTVCDLLKNISPDGLPLLSIPNNIPSKIVDDGCVPKLRTTCLKEVVVPHFDYAAYKDGSTFMSKLGLARTRRPAVGVYEWPINNTRNTRTCIRPLPNCAEDQTLPSPSLIFHCESPENEVEIREYGFREARIGYGGGGMNRGQVMLLHKDLIGLDIRYCPRKNVSSAFSEAQESLLAGTIEELQSTNVLLAGGEEANHDERTDNADCWIEERAKFKRPLGYLWSKSSSRKQRIAKIPIIPFE